MSVTQAVRNPRGYVTEKVAMYRALLFDPETFYDEYAGPVGLSREVVLIALIGLVGAAGTYFATTVLLGPFGPDPSTPSLADSATLRIQGNGVLPFVGAFLLWAAFSFVLYAVSWLYSTIGSLYLTFKYAAWAMLPMLFAFAIRSVAYFLTATNLEGRVDTNHPSGVTDVIVSHYWSQVAGEPLVLGAQVVGIVFALWTGYIATAAIDEVRDLREGEEYRVVAVPIAVYVLYTVYQVYSVATAA